MHTFPQHAIEARMVITAIQMWSEQSREPWNSYLSGLNNSIYKPLITLM